MRGGRGGGDAEQAAHQEGGRRVEAQILRPLHRLAVVAADSYCRSAVVVMYFLFVFSKLKLTVQQKILLLPFLAQHNSKLSNEGNVATAA